jgi:glycosyltransferase involved in cell wall biosynthesis
MRETIAVVDTSGQALLRHRGALLQALALSGAPVIAIAPDDHEYAGISRADLLNGFETLGARFRPVFFDRLGTNPLKDFRTLRAIVSEFARLRPAMAVCFTPKAIILARAAASMTRVRRFISILPGLGYLFGAHAAGRKSLRHAAHAALRYALLRSDRIIVQNPADRSTLAEGGFLRDEAQCVHVDGAGVDPKKFRYSVPPAGPARFLFMSRIYAEKGVREFAAAAGILKAENPALDFQVLGAFDRSPNSLTPGEVEGWEKSGLLRYLGHTSDVRPFLDACSALVLPSYYREGLPNCLIEAMLTGRPVVTTDWPGCRDAVQHGVNGLLVPPRDVPALAAAMRVLSAEPSPILAMGQAGRAIAEARFSTATVTARMLEAMEF